MRTFPLLSLGVLLLPAVARPEAPPARLDNWAAWRGPNCDGSAPHGDPPVKWDEKTNVKWKVEVPGRGSSTPVVWGDRVFLLSALDTGRKAAPADLPKGDPRFDKRTKPPQTYHQFVVLCYDRRSGKELWRHTAAEAVPHEGHHNTHTYAAYSPVTDGQRLYVHFGSFGVHCYDLDGKRLWTRDLGRLQTRLGWGEGGSPALHGDTLVVGRDQEGESYLIALDARTGATRWKVGRDEKTQWATPLITEYRGKVQVVTNGTQRVRSYDLADGKLLWECGGQTVNAIPSPLRIDDLALCMSGYRGSMALAIPLGSTGDVTDSKKIAWRYDRGTPYVPSPLLYQGRLYFTQANDALLTVLDARTGKALTDRQRLKGVSSFYASPVGAAGRVYFVGRDGTGVVLKSGDKPEVLAVNKLDDPIDASPAVVGKQLFLRGEGHLYCLEANGPAPAGRN
jgi:outer membrane protein assembly factor BamB